MAKKQNKKKNANSKKRKIIVGVVCGVFAAAAIGTGLGVGLTKCSGPTQPTNKFAIYFTPAPGDTGVDISTRVKYIDFGQTFAAVKDDVTATKKTAEGEWQFQWWYKDGDEPTRRMSDDIVIGNDPQVKSITLHPYFAEPLAKHTVTFSNGGDSSITIEGKQLQCEVEYGTKLDDVIKSYRIEAVKEGEAGEKWDFKYWSADGLVPDPDTPWKKPQNFDLSCQITTDVTLYPYFEKQEETWIEKTISWEEYAMSPSPMPAPKDFTLPPESEDTTSISTTISNFILSYNNATETIPELQKGEEVSIEASISPSSDAIYQKVDISYNVLPQSADTAPNKLNVEFTFNNLPTSDPKMYTTTTPLIFDVTPSLKFGLETHPCEKIEDLTIYFSDPWDAPKFEFSKAEAEQVTFKTEPGSKQYIVKHDDIHEHFSISRSMDNREKLEIHALDKNGKIIDNLLVEPIITDNGDGTADIDVAISFNEIQGIFEEHKVNFKLEFVTTFEGSGREVRKIIDNPFELVYTPEDREPYNMVMNDIIILDGNLGTSNISVQIENKAYPYFQVGDYLTVRNLTREECEDADDAPIYFTTPHEKIESEIIGKSPQIALQGKDAAKENLGFKIQFLDSSHIPTEITAYKETLQFDFWDDDPVKTPGLDPITTITRDITFIFSPKEWKNYTTADWAQYRSIIISMTANEGTEPGGKSVQKLGTAWVLSNISEEEQYYITSYDIKKDYLELSDTSKYSNFQFGYSNMGAAKQYVANDSTKYIMVDNDINDESISYTTTDLLISRNNGVEWVDENGTDEFQHEDKLYWDMTSQGQGLCAPNLAIFKLKPNDCDPEDDLKYEQTFKFRSAILNEWAKSEGLDPLHEDPSENGGQVSNLFEHVPDDFSRNGFSYGYTGGFKSKEVTFGEGGNKKTSRLVYWTDYTMKAQIGQLAYLSPTMYDNCEGYRDKMFMVRDPQEQVYHMCGAFTMTLNSFSKSSYYDDAGRGAMMLLRQYAEDGKSLKTPVIAGINWNGGSNWNWPGNITPYFDVWQYGRQQSLNLLAYYQNPQLKQP